MVLTSGKRKMAKARATLKEGTGKIRINKESLESWPKFLQLMMAIKKTFLSLFQGIQEYSQTELC